MSRHHRPVLGLRYTQADYPGSQSRSDAGPTGGPVRREELAATTAAVVVAAGRSGGPDTARLVALADTVGLETLAELWRDAPPDSLAGSLWVMYLLRTWCRTQGEQVLRLWTAGRAYAPADEVVAGVAERPYANDPSAVEALADAVLTGAYNGRFDVALERAAAFFRVVAAGRRELAGTAAEGHEHLILAQRNDRVAEDLAQAAVRWRAGELV